MSSKNSQLKAGGIIAGILVIYGSGLLAWGDVKNKTDNNEKNHDEHKTAATQKFKEIKDDQTKMLVQQTGLKKDISYLISMVEDLKK